jgi:hypothetical protein
MPIIDCLELYIDTSAALYPDTNGYLASSEGVKRFARVSGISLATWEPGRTWMNYLDELKQRRAGRGLETPNAYAPRARREAIVAASVEGASPRGRRDYWTPELCIEALRNWDRNLPAAAKRTQRAHQTAAVGNPDLRGLGQIQRHCGSFAAARDEAMRLNREA